MQNIDFSLFDSFQLKIETTELENTELETEVQTENKTLNFILTFTSDFLEL